MQSAVDNHQRQKKIRKRLVDNEVIRYLALYFGLVIMFFAQLHIFDSRTLNIAANGVITEPANYTDVETLGEVYNWLEQVVNTRVYTHTHPVKTDVNVPIFGVNRLITPIRLSQRRMELIDNEFGLVRKGSGESVLSEKVWESTAGMETTHETFHYYESNSDYGVDDKWKFSEEDSIGEVGAFSGFVRPKISYKELQLLYNEGKDEFQAKIEEQKAEFKSQLDAFQCDTESDTSCQPWIDSQTACLSVDYGTFNSNLGLFTYTVVTWERKFSGRVKSSAEIFLVPLVFYTNVLDYFRAALEVILFFVILVAFKEQIQQIRSGYHTLCTNDEVLPKLNNRKQKFVRKLKLTGMAILEYLTSFFNLLELSFTATATATFFLYILVLLDPERSAFSIENIEEYEDVGATEMNLMFRTGEIFRIYRRLAAVVLLVGGIKSVKYLKDILPESILFFETFDRAKKDLANFLIMITAMWCGFVMSVWISFGTFFEELGPWEDVASFTTRFFLGEKGVSEQFANFNRIVSFLFIGGFSVALTWLSFALLISIIIYYYRQSRRDYEEMEFSHPKIESTLNWQARVEDFWAYVKWKIQDAFLINRRQESREDYLKRRNKIHHSEEQRSKNEFGVHYNLDFTQRSIGGVAQDSASSVMASDKEKILIRTFESNKMKGYVINGFYYLIYVFLFAYVAVETLKTPTRFALFRAINPPDLFKLKEVVTIFQVDLQLRIPASNFWHFNNNTKLYSIRNFNYVTPEEQLVLTFSKGIEESALTNRFSYPDDRRIEGSSVFADDSFDHDLEATSPWPYVDFNGVHKTLPSQAEGVGYDSRGGYLFNLSIDDTLYTKQINALLESDLLDFYTHFLALDTILYNPGLRYYAYFAMIFDISITGEVRPDTVIRSIFTDPYGDSLAWLLTLFQLFFIIQTIKYTLNFYRFVVISLRDYKSWAKIALRSLTVDQWRKRHRRMPEWQRKLKLISSFDRFVDLLVIIASSVVIITWISVLIRLTEIPSLPLESDINHLRRLTWVLILFKDLTGIAALILTIKLLMFSKISRNVNNLKRVFSTALRDLIATVIICAGLLFGCTMFAYFIYGWVNESWRTFDLIILLLLNMGIGSFDYPELRDADPLLGPAFFFFFMFFFYIIIFNMQLPIILRAYEKEKERQKAVGEEHLNFIAVLCGSGGGKKGSRKDLEALEEQLHEKEEGEKDPLALLKGTNPVVGYYDVPEWARLQVGSIEMENQLRAKFQDPLIYIDHYFRYTNLDPEKILSLSKRKMGTSLKRKCFAVRHSGWNFLRVVSLVYNVHISSLRAQYTDQSERLQSALSVYTDEGSQQRLALIKELEELETKVAKQTKILKRIQSIHQLKRDENRFRRISTIEEIDLKKREKRRTEP